MGLLYSRSSAELLDNASESETKNKLDYTNLVLSGGGVKCIAHCGGLIYLEEIGVLEYIKHIAGTSVGSIIAALVSVGYTPKEIERELLRFDFECIDNSLTLTNFTTLSHYGWSAGSHIIKLVGTLIHAKTGNCNTTFKHLFQNTGVELVIYASDLNIQNTICFHKENTPNLPICQAVRMSLSIPFLFAPTLYDGHIILNGCILDNCPIHIFDGPTIKASISKEKHLFPPNDHTIAFDILSSDEPEPETETEPELDGIEDLFKTTLNIMVASKERKPGFRNIEIIIPSIPLTTLTISSNQKQELINCGYESCKTWFSNRK